MRILPFSLAALAVAGTALAAAWAPVWTYALSLALFGLPHVLVELRYVDERFGARLPRRAAAWLLGGLLMIALLRLAALGGLGTAPARTTAELLLGLGVVAAAVPLVWPQRRASVALALGAALLAGAALAPVTTLVLLALLHNLTPIGLLAERLRGPARRRALLGCALGFGVVPALLLWCEVPGARLDGPFATGELAQHLPTFVPPPWLGSTFADRLFAAAAYLQCLHYAVVLHVLPKLGGGSETAGARAAWPGRRPFAAAVVGLGALFTVGFVVDFAGARGVYAVFAAVHAWLELPVLALACGLGPRLAPATGALGASP